MIWRRHHTYTRAINYMYRGLSKVQDSGFRRLICAKRPRSRVVLRGDLDAEALVPTDVSSLQGRLVRDVTAGRLRGVCLGGGLGLARLPSLCEVLLVNLEDFGHRTSPCKAVKERSSLGTTGCLSPTATRLSIDDG